MEQLPKQISSVSTILPTYISADIYDKGGGICVDQVYLTHNWVLHGCQVDSHTMKGRGK